MKVTTKKKLSKTSCLPSLPAVSPDGKDILVISSDEELEKSMVEMENWCLWKWVKASNWIFGLIHDDEYLNKNTGLQSNGKYFGFDWHGWIPNKCKKLYPVFARMQFIVKWLFCCRFTCSKVGDVSLSDGQIFQCKYCFKRYSIRTQSFWTKSKLPLTVLLSLLFFFSKDIGLKQTYDILKKRISKKAIVQWFNYFRDIMTTYLSNFPIRFNCQIVHCDETFIGESTSMEGGVYLLLIQDIYLELLIKSITKQSFSSFPKEITLVLFQ